jgi:hypothetical protein
MKPTGGFDYSGLDPDDASLARRVAEKSWTVHGQTIELMLDLGQEWTVVKKRLGHGHFGAWLQTETPYSARTVELFMTAAAVFGDKPEIISHLPSTTVHLLAAPKTPVRVRDEVKACHDRGESLDARTIKEKVRDAREADERERAKITSEVERNRLARNKANRDRNWEKGQAKRDRKEAERQAAQMMACDMIVKAIGGGLAGLVSTMEIAGRITADDLRAAARKLAAP